MTDFRAAFERGQDAATEAELARREIDAVFKELTTQLAEATNGTVEMYRREYEKSPLIPSYLFGSAGTYWAIVARNPKAKGKNERQLARWEQGRSGYPCKISWGGVDHTCHDRESLEWGLVSLLEDPVTGKRLSMVSNLPPPGEGDDTTTAE